MALFLNNQRFPVLPALVQVRFKQSRRPHEKLPIPEDKSNVIIGKVKKVTYTPTPGVSDKQYPILMKWNKPQRIQTVNPSISGDIGGLEYFGEVDLSQPPVELAGAPSLEKLDEVAREILSLEFARSADVMNKLKQTVGDSVKRHPLDKSSLEYKITILTLRIRNFQRMLVECYPYKNQSLKHDLTFKIALRRSYLERLREQDYKKYEWLLERLNIFYKPVPHYDHNEISRKASIERLTDIWCDELKKHRLDGLRRKLESEQPHFLRSKAEKLRFIMNEEKELGLEQTVTEAEIEECLKRAEQVEKRNAAKADEMAENFLVYEEEKEEEQQVFIR